MNSFGNWEEPNEYTDYQAPWNPRADGYQSTGGSSSGSAAAIAAYDWLDFAIGTDTWGSVTRPGLWCGCFALRPSTGATSGEGIEPLVKLWDVPGIISRDIRKLQTIASEWLLPEGLQSVNKPPSSIVWASDFWTVIAPEQVDIARSFIRVIASTLCTEERNVSFKDKWAQSPPQEVGSASLLEYTVTATHALSYEGYHHYEDFRRKYWETHDRAPYTSQQNEKGWELGKTVTKEEAAHGFQRIEVYRKWFERTVLECENSSSNPLVIMPLESVRPRYRDETHKFKRPPQDGIHALALGPVLGAPVLTVPIHEIPYASRVTKREEKLPFAIAVMGLPGTDLALLNTIKNVLESANLPVSVNTGQTMYGPHFADSTISVT